MDTERREVLDAFAESDAMADARDAREEAEVVTAEAAADAPIEGWQYGRLKDESRRGREEDK
jgi:hypothetical protein